MIRALTLCVALVAVGCEKNPHRPGDGGKGHGLTGYQIMCHRDGSEVFCP